MTIRRNEKNLFVKITFITKHSLLQEKSIILHNNQKNLIRMANLNRIKVVLVENKKTGKWLAEQLGKSNCTVSKWCSNTVQPDLMTLNEIANKLGVNVTSLLVSNQNLK